MNRYLLLLILLSPLFTLAQSENVVINQRDNLARAHGLWYIHNNSYKGEPETTIFGYYNHGFKEGIWYANDGVGDIKSIETYRNGVLDGEVKYFEKGRLTCIGHYRGLNPNTIIDTVHIVHPISGDEYFVPVPSERGSVKHGSWRFYDELSGRLIKEENYQADNLVFEINYKTSASDSAFYEHRNALLPHNNNKLPPASKFKTKAPSKSLIGNY